MLGCRERTFRVDGHHYALVHVTGLEPAATIPYEVRLDGARVWPQDLTPYPPSVIRTHDPGAPVPDRLGLVPGERAAPAAALADQGRAPRGSRGRRAAGAGRPHVPRRPRRLAARARPARRPGLRRRGRARGASSRSASAATSPSRRASRSRTSRSTRCSTATRGRSRTSAGCSRPCRRAMIFDDHDVHDDWNTSRTWVEDMRATGWWDDRIVGGLASLLALPAHGQPLAASTWPQDDVYRALREAEDGGPLLREYAFRADREVEGTRWSYCRDFGALAADHDRLARGPGARSARGALDARPGRVGVVRGARAGRLRPPADRNVAAVAARAGAALPRGLERGGLQRRLGQARRRGSARSCARPSTSSTGRRSGCRSSGSWRSCARSGARAAARRRRSSRCRATCTTPTSPRSRSRPGARCARPSTRRPARRSATRSTSRERRSIKAACTKPVAHVARAFARAAGVGPPPVRWRLTHDEPYFDNQVCFLELDGRRSRLWLQKTAPGEDEGYSLETVFERRLA